MSLCVMKVSLNVEYCHRTSFLASHQFPPLGVSGVEESRAAAIVRPGQTGLGCGVQEVSWDTASTEWDLWEWKSGWFGDLWQFYQVCTRVKVVKRSRNVTTSIILPQIQMSWSFDLHGRVQSVMWLLLLLAVGGKAPACFTFPQGKSSNLVWWIFSPQL